MKQPSELKTDAIYPAAEGRGNEVWATLEAAATGDLVRLKRLFAADPLLLHCGGYYRTPLEFAIAENQLEVVRYLLESGIDAASRRWREQPALMAADRGFTAIGSLLKDHGRRQYGVHPEGDRIASAIQVGDAEEAKACIRSVADGVQAADQYGNRPLHWAVLTRQLDLIDWLLDQGADVNAPRPDGARPLDLTPGDYWHRSWYRDVQPEAIRDDAVLVGYLLARGADYDIVTGCRVGDLGRVREILDESPEEVHGTSAYSSLHCRRPLSTAARLGFHDIVRLLLDHGADPNHWEKGAPFGAALHSAAWHDHLDIAETLLDAGADPNQEVDSCVNCLLVAKSEAMRSLLRSRGAAFPSWHLAREGMADLMEQRLEQEPSLANDVQVFAEAVAAGHEDVVQVLLCRQSDLWERMPAIAGRTPDITRWMFRQGMRANRADWLEATALHRFAAEGDRSNAELFLEHGADIHAIDWEYQSTPLGWAVRCGQTEMVKFLLAEGADPIACGASWAAPQAWADKRNHRQIAKLLDRATS